jgi:PTS system nitrogen regulatory IIA component
VGKAALVILEHISKKLLLLLSHLRQKELIGSEEVSFSKYLDADLISFTTQTSRDLVIKELTALLKKKGHIQSEEEFYEAVINREKIVSTAIGVGVAIPHAKLENCEHFFIAVGIHTGKGIEWKALDGSLVKLIFLIGGPANQQKEYLTILSHLTALMKQEKVRNQLLQYKTPQEVAEFFKSYDR